MNLTSNGTASSLKGDFSQKDLELFKSSGQIFFGRDAQALAITEIYPWNGNLPGGKSSPTEKFRVAKERRGRELVPEYGWR